MIECRDLTKSFGDHRAVDRVNLSIRPGEFFSLLGPSGCGKTTLLRLIGGFEQPDSGVVLIDGEDLTAEPPYRRPVNQVFQSYALFPHLSVEQNVAFGLKMSGVPRAELRIRVADAIAMVSLNGLERRKPAQLSGGQKQRVALARAIINRPKVLLLDEPLAALDAQLRHVVQLELKQLQQRLGITFVFVTHDQDEAMRMSDRLAVVNAGAILQLDTPREIYERPENLAVATFVGQSNRLTAQRSPHDSHVLQTADGLRLSLPFEAPESATLVIRPHHVERSDQDDAHFSTTMQQTIFRGEMTQHLLRTASGEQLTASGWNLDAPLKIGSIVHCRVSSRNILAFNAAGQRIDHGV